MQTLSTIFIARRHAVVSSCFYLYFACMHSSSRSIFNEFLFFSYILAQKICCQVHYTTDVVLLSPARNIIIITFMWLRKMPLLRYCILLCSSLSRCAGSYLRFLLTLTVTLVSIFKIVALNRGAHARTRKTSSSMNISKTIHWAKSFT